MKRIGILGSGTWGAALANLLVSNGHEVTLWSKFPSEINEIAETHKHRNLPGVVINEHIIFTSDLEKAVKDKDVIVNAKKRRVIEKHLNVIDCQNIYDELIELLK